MLQVANISAWISIDGTKLTEYAVEKKGSAVSCWIASEVGKNFSVNWECGKTARLARGKVFVDGVVCARLMMRTQTLAPGSTKAYYADAVRSSATTERPLIFSFIETTDDDQYLATTNSRAGEISLEIYEGDIIGKKEKFTPCKFTGPEKVHEKSKKALVHQVGLGDERQYNHGIFYTTAKNEVLVASFVFRYRPIEYLRANGTAPLPPTHDMNANTPSTSTKRRAPTEDEAITISDSESQDEDVQALQAVEAQLLVVQEQLRKKRRKTTQVKSEPEVKLEHGLVKKEKVDVKPRLNGEVIDLT
ncbi:hypothetical protein K435DRAFT_854624 [Dendrothele bispora CBS 962.96]|uniref:DUF7918 domain-containing protein n=1 Tax=Dendrothele bispora (strain CBS 962.96) TaxID=1314807 RepID=A0A4S8MDA1_DENBC|nr:hypothetical protein K435DRAFT_854624 [Dendrothele bispora CBS 962.96]